MTQTASHRPLTSPTLLNAILYTALAIAFPMSWERIQVHKQGTRRIASRLLGLDGPPEEYGEEYHLNCPFCGDQRKRLWVSYTYDPYHNPHRWKCINEECQRNPSFRQQLSEAIMRVWADAKAMVRLGTLPPVTSDSEADGEQTNDCSMIIQMPEDFCLLHQLPPAHHARQYIESRGFDPNWLGSQWLVGYSGCSSTPKPAFHDRLVIPLILAGPQPSLLGWQARAIRDEVLPKYLTKKGMPKSRILYTSPIGITPSDRLIVAEGVADVWRCGADAVGIFGKKPEAHQIRLIVAAAQGRQKIIVALDRDAEPEAQELGRRLESAVAQTGAAIQVLRCPPPSHRKDYGECTYEEAQQALVTPSVPMQTIVSRSRQEFPRDVPRSRPELASQLIQHATGRPVEQPADLERQIGNLGMQPLLDRIEVPLIPVINEMTRTGLRIDRSRLESIVQAEPTLRQPADRLLAAIDPVTQRVYANLNQVGSRTGRITASGFPLQNLNRPLRGSMIADEGLSMFVPDFSQFDWRVAAVISNDQTLLTAFQDPHFDIYRFAMSRVTGFPESAVTDSQRSDAKPLMMNFLFTLNSTPDSPEARALWQALRQSLPQLISWREQLVEEARRSHIVRSAFGRTMTLDLNPESSGISASQTLAFAIQGTAADVFKIALLRLRSVLPPEVRFLLPHHDAVLMDAPTPMVRDVCNRIRVAMETPPEGWPISFPVRLRSGHSWAECTA